MRKNYFLVLLVSSMSFFVNAQTVIIDQPVVGTNGIVSDDINGVGTYSSDDFVLDVSYNIQTIVASGFGSAGSDISVNMTGLDVYIYTDSEGSPSSDPSVEGAGVLEITNLLPTHPSITVADGVITIDVALANGSDVILAAGTYWLIVAPRVADGAVRWNWFGSDAGGNAQLIDEGNFGAGLPWTPIPDLGVAISSLAFSISGTANLSNNEVSFESLKVYPNPAKESINIDYSLELTSVELYTVLGKLVYQGTNERTIDISKLDTGLYLLKLTNETGTLTKRIVKE